MATEAFRKQVSRQLTELQDGRGPDTIEWPSTLSSEERKYIHNLCHKFGLKSKSKGGGLNRYLTVSRKNSSPGGTATSSKPGTISASTSFDSASTPSEPSKGAPFRLPAKLDACIGRQFAAGPAVPTQWPVRSPAEQRYLSSDSWRKDGWKGGKGGKGAAFRQAESVEVSREALDAAEEERLCREPSYASSQGSRQSLPAWSRCDEVLAALQSSRVVLVAGETGCGKSTQVPQFLLDAAPEARMVVTQPRRIAAVSLAQRVAEERCEELGGTVGYSIHLDTKSSRDTRCLFCTTGVFRRRLLSDPELSSLTHILVDEVHERELHSDFVLIILKQLLEERPSLQLVLMSATLQTEVFQRFFPGSAVVSIPGRTFPVKRHYLNDVAAMLHKNRAYREQLGPAFAAAGFVTDEKDFKRQVATGEGHPDLVCGYGRYLTNPMTDERLSDGCRKHDVLQQGKGTTFDVPIIEALILHLNQEHARQGKAGGTEAGAILVFLPGWSDIEAVRRRLRDSMDQSKYLILPCHSQVRVEQQRQVFKRPPKGVRKIILASNIAETSITIEDVTVVIDTGRAKETSYDPYLKVGTLATVFVSKASAQQRAGRAGRVRAGTCYHLFSRERHEEMEQFRLPELVRSPLEDVCLHTAHLLAKRKMDPKRKQRPIGAGTQGVASWLAMAPQPPEAVSVRNAVELLKMLGALTAKGEITNLGVKFASLPVAVTMARSLLWAPLFGCLDAVLTILGATSGRDVFQLPYESNPGRKGGGKSGKSSNFGQASAILRKQKKEVAGAADSDHLAILWAVHRYEEAKASGEGALRALCDRCCLNRRSIESVIEFRDKMKSELKNQKLLPPWIAEFANRNAEDQSIILAVVLAGVFPNLAVRRANEKKLLVNGGRIDAKLHQQSIAEAGKGNPGGKGGGKASNTGGPAAWFCYSELTQVEESYSLMHVSRASPAALLLLCGDGKVELQGSGADVEASLLSGWVDFVVPRAQAQNLQKMRYRLHQAFHAYCEGTFKIQEQQALLDAAAALLRSCVDESGKPTAVDASYRPNVTISRQPSTASLNGDSDADYAALEAAAAKQAAAVSGFAAPRAKAKAAPTAADDGIPWQAKETLEDGMELAAVHQLVQRLYPPAAPGQKPLDWQYANDGGMFTATVVVAQDGSAYVGEPMDNKKTAQRSAAAVAWQAMKAWELEQLGYQPQAEGEGQEDVDMAVDDGDAVDDGEDEVLEVAVEEEDAGAWPLAPAVAEEEEAEEVAELHEELEDGDAEAPVADALEADEEVAEYPWIEDGGPEAGIAEEEVEVLEEEEMAYYQQADALAEEVQPPEEEDDLLDDLLDPAAAAALKFMEGDLDYKEYAGDMDDGHPLEEMDEVVPSAAKRPRLG
eukprot:TRINITY_DN24105_c0_g1_i1.p1 TRINITY_DN24105_c0_g1~~TRINITY_DN24105_c0_g1_i1.p1  ORF type:complete len:1378 (-),score=333.07 TRINITY_DN24105_c0_g1_i1:7-4140(-)